jgi:uracil-DNA glycosylase
MKKSLSKLANDVRHCKLCADKLPLGPRPVIQVSSTAKILIAGQAPGSRVHESGIPFDDPSGDRLRDWMGIDRETFYNAAKIAILPMGFCYPGTGKSGDLPPIPLCAETWRNELLSRMKSIQLVLVIGQYAQKWHLRGEHKSLTDTVKNWKSYGDELFPLPHPSPRNNIWLKKNPWFEKKLLPELKDRIGKLLTS